MNNYTAYYEFWADGGKRLVKRGNKFLDLITISQEINSVPTMSITVPLEELESDKMNNYEIKVFINNKYFFWGVVDAFNIVYAGYAVTINLSHIMAKHRNEYLPINMSVKNMPLPNLFNNMDFAVRDFEYRFDVAAQNARIEYTFSSDNKLTALNDAVSNTENIHFRANLGEKSKIIEFGQFGQTKPIIIGQARSFREDENTGLYENVITMLTEPTKAVDYTTTYNRAVVLAGDVGADVLQVTLKPIHDNPALQNPEFPVGMYNKSINAQPAPQWDENKKTINNEKTYKDLDMISYISNTNREYYITDKVQLEADSGIVKQTIYNFSDLYPVPSTDDIITDEDRQEIAKRAYAKAIRQLRSERPIDTFQFNCTALPKGVNVGDKVRFMFHKEVKWIDDLGEHKTRVVTHVDDTMFITSRIIHFDNALNETTTVTLDKELRINPIPAVALELAKQEQEKNRKKKSGKKQKVKASGGPVDYSALKGYSSPPEGYDEAASRREWNAKFGL